METVCNRLSNYLPCYATAYGNGVSPPKIPRTAAQATQGLSGLIILSQSRTRNGTALWFQTIMIAVYNN